MSDPSTAAPAPQGVPEALLIAARRARPGEYAAAGDLVADTYRDEGFVHGDYLAVLRDGARRAAEADLLVAVAAGGRVVGTITYADGGTPFADVAEGDEAEFRMLAVAPAARGRGLGERPVRACIERARTRGKRRLAISTQPEMGLTHRLYQRIGFARAPKRDWSPAPAVDLRVFTLDLTPPEPAPESSA